MSGNKGPYLKEGRLADVMALVQVLALDVNVERSEKGIKNVLQIVPVSADAWTTVAKEHPEFFRTRPDKQFALSLISRRVLPENAEGYRRLSPEFVGQLLNTAVEIHDRQVRRDDRWTYLIPIWVALIVVGVPLIGVGLKLLFGG